MKNLVVFLVVVLVGCILHFQTNATIPTTRSYFKEVILADVNHGLKLYEDNYNWVVANTAWQNVETTDRTLSVYGRDVMQFNKFGDYLREKLSDSILKGNGVLSNEGEIEDAIKNTINSK